MATAPYVGYQYVGYQGYKQDVKAPSLKTGETLGFRDVKFASTKHGVVYPNAPPIDATTLACSASTFCNVHKGDYKVPDKKGACYIEGEPPADRSKPFLHKTLHEESFRDFPKEVVKLAQAPPEEYHRAFSELAAATAQHPLYMDEKDAVTGAAFEQRIDVKDVQIVLKAVHGAETPQWLADRLMKVCEGRRDGKLSWSEFATGLDRLIESTYKERDVLLQRTTLPEWVTISRKVFPTVQHGKLVESCYQTDLGVYGTVPKERALTYKRGMLSTTHDLYGGTTKGTYHIPGYGGFIPACKVNARAYQHGDMRYPRETQTNLRLVHRHNMAGYTGHCPRAAVNDVGAMTGCFKSTEPILR